VNAPLSLTEYETLVEPFNVLNVVDYGDVATNPFNMMVTQEELRKVTREVAETGAIPVIIGGDLVEYNPMMDNRGMQTARMVRHLALAILGGIAMNALEMDPEYVHPQLTGELNK
jgi:arginase family enzyme